MFNSSVDRNLLFGILALQTNFINREDLLAAFTAWVADKRRSLGEILCEQGKLTQPQDEVLRELTEEHVKHHGNDSNQSLAAITSVGWLWAELFKLNDPQLNEWLGKSFPSDSFVPVSTAPGQRFHILRHHADGGQGTVSVALDTELQREVALKQIKPLYADNSDVRARFVHEAEITGSLEHPGIVPVYGLGRSLEGRPFYAMRFIRGESLRDAIERFHKSDIPGREPGERTLKLRELLGRFIDVCDAIEYAHSRGVLHRDLKPENIVLGKYGETLLIDLGLAKATGRDELAESDITERPLQASPGQSVKETIQGSAVGTPEYMSPEQAAGRRDLVNSASDVYGLGATLYCLLTGQPPFSRKDEGDILLRVQKGEFPPPRQVKPQVPAALQAICLKAMKLKPTDRYPSPKMLADDIEHWLADEPVACYPEPLHVRARRWVKRHPALVVGTAATVLISLASAVAIASIVTQSNHSLAAKNLELDAKNTALEQANQRERNATKLAEKNATKAEQNATVAREQSQLALKSLNSVIFDIQRKLKNVPGAGDLQRSLLQTALARLQEVSDQFASRGAIDHNTAAALNDLGDVFLRIGTGSSGDAAEGAVAAARKLYERSLEIAQKLVAADPNHAQAQRDLSISYNKLGDVLRQSGQVTEALAQYQKGLEIRQKLAAADPSDTRAQRELSVSYERLGNVLLQSGHVTEALGQFQKSLKISQQLAAADPSDAQAQRDLSVSYSKLGDVLLQSGQVTEALGQYQKCVEISQQLAAADPSDAQAQRDLCVLYGKLGDVLLQSRQVTEALGEYQKGLEIFQKLAAADPSDAQAQRDLSISYERLGEVQLQSGHVTEALGQYQKSLEISQKLAAADPSDAQAQRDLSISYTKLGDVSLQAGHAIEALGYYQKDLEISQKLAAADPTDAQAQFDLYVSHHRIAAVHKEQKQYELAIESYGRGLKVLQTLKEQKRLAPANEKWIGIVAEAIAECRKRMADERE